MAHKAIEINVIRLYNARIYSLSFYCFRLNVLEESLVKGDCHMSIFCFKLRHGEKTLFSQLFLLGMGIKIRFYIILWDIFNQEFYKYLIFFKIPEKYAKNMFLSPRIYKANFVNSRN